MQNDFDFCPKCGGKNIRNVKMRKWVCTDCNFDLYNNVAAAVGLVIQTDSGEILFERRAKEPRRNFLAFPGGFVDPDESAEEAAERECFEEIGVKPEKIEYIATFPNTYDYKGIRYKTCDIFYKAVLPKNATLKAQEGEVLSLEPHFARNKAEVDSLDLAFDSARKTLEKLLEKN